jgi:hypothetical protein
VLVPDPDSYNTEGHPESQLGVINTSKVDLSLSVKGIDAQGGPGPKNAKNVQVGENGTML